jgi:hypothetical protein
MIRSPRRPKATIARDSGPWWGWGLGSAGKACAPRSSPPVTPRSGRRSRWRQWARFHRYKNADQLKDGVVAEAFDVVKLGGDAVHEVRRRVQQDALGHRGRCGDPALRHPPDPAPPSQPRGGAAHCSGGKYRRASQISPTRALQRDGSPLRGPSVGFSFGPVAAQPVVVIKQ